MPELNTPLKNIPLISPKYIKILEKMGLLTVRDLLFHFPFRYDDFRQIVPISQEYLDQNVTIEGMISKSRNSRSWKKRMAITEITIEDEIGAKLKAVWFNQPFILDSLRAGSNVRLSGKLTLKDGVFFMSNPAWERSARDATNTGRLVPVYPETKGITSKWLRWQIKELIGSTKNAEDVLSGEIREKYNLYDLLTALTQIHFPESQEKLVRAQKRFAFEEMFLIQLQTLRTKKEWENKNSARIEFDEKLIKDFVNKLPFNLTDAQRKASFEILKDLEKPRPMNRLLNGDVGAGKTVVAAIAALQAIKGSGTFFHTATPGEKKVPDPLQVAIMAPTEVLARQHYFTFCELLKNYDLNVGLMTNSYREINNSKFLISNFKSNPNDQIPNARKNTREILLQKIKNGEIDLIIGTHALIQKDIRFKQLALVIIDEQHRFGVAQRAALQKEAESIHDGNPKIIPHLLTMTATPIPRTLAIAFFGSLDLSVLDEMPRNRKKIITRLIIPDERIKIYEFIRSEIKKGRQAFIILPLIEESESESMADVKAVKVEHERLQKKVFPELKIGLLHGQLKAKEKEEVMAKFKDKEYDILVSTSVVEVGIDVPNATAMIIENADRFGLSQLHQFRGRVGRGEHQSYCFLFSDKRSERLKIMEKTNDGFEIAEKDLELRGPGQFFGTVQSGLPDITMENLGNIKLIKFARNEALEILDLDPELSGHSALRNALRRFKMSVHME